MVLWTSVKKWSLGHYIKVAINKTKKLKIQINSNVKKVLTKKKKADLKSLYAYIGLENCAVLFKKVV